MRVLQLISSAGHYGAENMLVNLARAVERLGCRSIVGVFENDHRPNMQVAERARQLGLAVELIPCRGRADLRTMRILRGFIRTKSIDLVHAHGYKADLYAYTAARGTGVPVLATCHNWPDKTLALRFYEFLDHIVLKRFPRVVAVSEGVAQSLRRFGMPEDRISMIGNGIELDAFASAQPTLVEEIGKRDRLVVGMVGRLVPAKGADYLLRAAREILQSFPKTLWVFIGEGPERGNLERLARDLGIEANVIFAGQRQDMPGVYASLDLLVLPSLTEGMPMTILEAMAARKPVVATRVGAVPRIVIPERTGLLTAPANIEDLRDALARLLADAELRRRMGQQGHALVREHYSAESMAENYLHLYQSLLAATPHKVRAPAETAKLA